MIGYCIIDHEHHIKYVFNYISNFHNFNVHSVYNNHYKLHKFYIHNFNNFNVHNVHSVHNVDNIHDIDNVYNNVNYSYSFDHVNNIHHNHKTYINYHINVQRFSVTKANRMRRPESSLPFRRLSIRLFEYNPQRKIHYTQSEDSFESASKTRK
ncbi:hypothetical protein HDU99_005369 [Rhizoclosmatium hyalinum]|nr:hypothetical protein HDU99_005369 [Rhizoclosmatium hyalinum]